MTKLFSELQQEVGQWSEANFGLQESKAVQGQVLGSLAPLLGIVEEMGEIFESVDMMELEDAIADATIYLLDFSFRESLTLPALKLPWMNGAWASNPDNEKPPAAPALVPALSHLCRTVLKHHQGIRGYTDEKTYRNRAYNGVLEVLWALSEMVRVQLPGKDYLEIVNRVWNEVVSKRDWKKSPESGVSSWGGTTPAPNTLP